MERILISRYVSPAGEMIIGAYGKEVCLCDWAVDDRRARIDGRVCRRLNAEYAEGMTAATEQAMAELDEYFAGLRREFTVSVRLAGSEFQCRVWRELMKIAYGTTVTYGELARRMGMPRAVRAVAGACGANALSILVPCHRVTGSGGLLTGYAGGLAAKSALLDIEGRGAMGRAALPAEKNFYENLAK